MITYIVPYGADILVEENTDIKKGQSVFRWDPYTDGIVATHDGSIKYIDIKENVTYREELDDATGMRQRMIIETRNRNLSPQIQIISVSLNC